MDELMQSDEFVEELITQFERRYEYAKEKH